MIDAWAMQLYLFCSTLYMSDNQKAVAEKLIQADAVRLNLKEPFTWTSGWKSPVYCDNRILLSYPFTRDFIKSELCSMVFQDFPEADALAGVATAGIAWGAMVADQLKLPFAYVRSSPKAHGLGNQLEGRLAPGSKVLVMEDLVSTGKSSLAICSALKDMGYELVGLVSIFNYGFPQPEEAFNAAGIRFQSLTNYEVLIKLAIEKGIVQPGDSAELLNWRSNPEKWNS